MLRFFDYLSSNIEDCESKLDILTSRLYKRYIRIEELNRTLEEIDCVLGFLKMDNVKNFSAEHICNSLTKSVEEVLYFHKSLNSYDPIRIGITEIPAVFDDDLRDLSEYDNLEGPPFWLREYLKEYPDTVLPF
jgi:hypothetical protein